MKILSRFFTKEPLQILLTIFLIGTFLLLLFDKLMYPTNTVTPNDSRNLKSELQHIVESTNDIAAWKIHESDFKPMFAVLVWADLTSEQEKSAIKRISREFTKRGWRPAKQYDVTKDIINFCKGKYYGGLYRTKQDVLRFYLRVYGKKHLNCETTKKNT